MQQVDPKYTKNTIAEGERVKNQILSKLDTTVEFEFQGSVPLDVHILGVSDIDILVLLGSIFSIDPEGRKSRAGEYSQWTGTGNSLTHLIQLRKDLEILLTDAYPSVDVDISGDKAIGLSGGSLRRKVDVVPSHWYDSATYQQNLEKKHREVKILQKSKGETFTNRPFLHIENVNQRDIEANGNVKKIIRMLKNLKADSDQSDQIKTNSYEIAGLVYHFDLAAIRKPIWNELALVAATQGQLGRMIANKAWTMELQTPDGIRKIVDTEEKFSSLSTLLQEVKTLGLNLAQELSSTPYLNEMQAVKTLEDSYISESY